tara:strand:- start:51 stop:272 length:222 start_codon:yes stop_codon:yes gene_type:complete
MWWYWINLTKEAALSAGRRHEERPESISLDFQNSKPIVGFFFHNASMLAPVSKSNFPKGANEDAHYVYTHYSL